MKYIYDKEFGISCEPDCTEEWLELIFGVGFDYDGCNTVESLKGLVDELVKMAQNARKCLQDGKIFYDEEEENRSREAAIAERERNT